MLAEQPINYMPTVSPIFIDKLALTYELYGSERSAFVSHMRDIARDSLYSLPYYGYRYRNVPYHHCWILDVPQTGGATCEIYANCIFANGAFLRLEWNPRNTGRRGNRYIFSFLEDLLPNQIDVFCHLANVTRLDLAVDVHPITPDTMWITSPRLRLSKLNCGPSGEIRSIRLGSETGAHHVAIYTHHDEGGQNVDRSVTTRLEIRLRNLGDIQSLQSIANPFSGLIIFRAAGELLAQEIEYKYLHFLYAVRAIGMHAALRTIPWPASKRLYRRFLEENFDIDYWNPDEIFAGYPITLAEISGAIEDVLEPNPAYIRRYRRRRRINIS